MMKEKEEDRKKKKEKEEGEKEEKGKGEGKKEEKKKRPDQVVSIEPGDPAQPGAADSDDEAISA